MDQSEQGRTILQRLRGRDGEKERERDKEKGEKEKKGVRGRGGRGGRGGGVRKRGGGSEGERDKYQ